MFIENYVFRPTPKRKNLEESEYILYLDELISTHLITL